MSDNIKKYVKMFCSTLLSIGVFLGQLFVGALSLLARGFVAAGALVFHLSLFLIDEFMQFSRRIFYAGSENNREIEHIIADLEASKIKSEAILKAKTDLIARQVNLLLILQENSLLKEEIVIGSTATEVNVVSGDYARLLGKEYLAARTDRPAQIIDIDAVLDGVRTDAEVDAVSGAWSRRAQMRFLNERKEQCQNDVEEQMADAELMLPQYQATIDELEGVIVNQATTLSSVE